MRFGIISSAGTLTTFVSSAGVRRRRYGSRRWTVRYHWTGKGAHPPKVKLHDTEFAVDRDGKLEIKEHQHRWERMLKLVEMGFAPEPESFPSGVHSGMRRFLRSKGIKGF
jgi:hypothetical protein